MDAEGGEDAERDADQARADQERHAGVGGERREASAAEREREDAVADRGEDDVQDDDARYEPHQARRTRTR